MDKFQIPEAARPYTEALRKLLPAGVTAAPGLENSPLVDLDVVVAHATASADNHDKATVFTELLAELTKDGETGPLMGKDREVAARLFGLHEWAGVPSRQRYDAVAKLYDKHWTWENFRKEPLDRHLYAVYLALRRQVKPHAAPADGTVKQAEPFQYRLCDYDMTYRMPPTSSKPRETLEVREIEALADGVTTWRTPVQYWGKGADVVPDITLFGPGKLSVRADAPIVGSGGVPGRAYVTEVVFPTPLNKGQRIRFTLLKRQLVEFTDLVRPDWCDAQSLLPTLPIEKAHIRICFPDKQTPKEIWHYEELEEWLAPGVNTDASHLNTDVGNTVVHHWEQLRVGLEYGVAWRW